MIEIEVSIDILGLDGTHFWIDSKGHNSHWDFKVLKTGDKFAKLLGDTNASISVGLIEKVGGPQYSSASVHVQLKLTCNQDVKTVREAVRIAYEEAALLIDEHIGTSMKTLFTHIEEHRGGEG